LTFASSSSFSKWRDAAKQATGGDGTLVLGDQYAVEAPNADTATAIAAAVGGTTQ
jgi:dihydroxyacetone kinase